MKKFFLSAFVILAFVIYSIHQRFGQSEGSGEVAPKKVIDSGISNPLLQKTKASTQPSPSLTNLGVQPQAKFKDGQYTGDVTDAYYGNVQVKAVINGGKITDVVFLDYPHDRNTSIRINSQAMPYLTEEAIQAQSANVDIISGATQTSRAFRESLQSALDKAKV